MNRAIDDILTVDIIVKAESLQEDIFRIYTRLFPNVTEQSQLQFGELPGGYVNNITKVSTKIGENEAIIFRTFGMKFKAGADEEANEADLNGNSAADLVDIVSAQHNHQLEYAVINEVSKHGLCKPVLLKYQNGICYAYTPGTSPDGALMLTEQFLEEAALKFARFHSIKFEAPEIPFRTHYDRLFKQVFPPLQKMLEEMDKHIALINEFPYSELPRLSVLLDHMERAKKIFEELGYSRIGFCYNDGNQKNLVWSAENGLSFIDFEVSLNNYVFWDLGYFLGCFPGSFLYDFDRALFPSADQRRRFLTSYLKHFHKLNGIQASEEEFTAELENLFRQANLSALLYLGRLVMVGGLFDQNPNMFHNEDHRKSRANDKYFCGRYSLQVYQLYAELAPQFMSEAEQHLRRKKQAGKTIDS